MKEGLKNIKREFLELFWKRQKVLDIVLPPLVFLILNTFLSLGYSIIISVLIALLTLIWRLYHGQKFLYALGGLLGVLISALSAYIFADARNYFLPSLIKNAAVSLALFFSILIRRPLVAYASHISRGWDLKWYWHKNVLPAYQEVTLLWALFYALRVSLQYDSISLGTLGYATFINLISGMPAFALLLVVSFIYGVWRLTYLNAPSLDEFKNNEPPPYKWIHKSF